MKTSIDSYVEGIMRDNLEYIMTGYDSVADYIISTSNDNYYEFFDESEYEGEPSSSQIAELKEYLRENYGQDPYDEISELSTLGNVLDSVQWDDNAEDIIEKCCVKHNWRIADSAIHDDEHGLKLAKDGHYWHVYVDPDATVHRYSRIETLDNLKEYMQRWEEEHTVEDDPCEVLRELAEKHGWTYTADCEEIEYNDEDWVSDGEYILGYDENQGWSVYPDNRKNEEN